MDVHFSSEDSLPSGLLFFLSWNSPSGIEQFCILSESFYPILIDVFPVWSVVAMYFYFLYS